MYTTEEQSTMSGEDLLNSRQVVIDPSAEPSGETPDTEQPAERPDEEQPATHPNSEWREKLKQCYLEEARLLCPTLSLDSPEGQRLGMLHRKIKRILKVLTNFDRLWEKGLGEIEKACLHYLITQDIPRTGRKEIFEEFSTWFDFLVNAAFNRSFVTQLVQDYCHQLHDLEYLLSSMASAAQEEEQGAE